MTVCADTYRALLEHDDLSPMFRGEFQYQLRLAEKREAIAATLTQDRRRERLTYKWQQDALRTFHHFLAKEFELRAWERRERKPLWLAEARNDMEAKRRGIEQRLVRARRDATEGCRMQADWLALHSELIDALEQPQGKP